MFNKAEQSLDELHPELVRGRRTVDDLNDAYRVLSAQLSAQAHPFEDYLYGDNQAGGGIMEETRRQYLKEQAERDLRVAQARAGFETLTAIQDAYHQVVKRVGAAAERCNQILGQLTEQVRPPAGHAAGETRFDMAFGLLLALAAPQVADILSGRTPFPSDPAAVHDAWMLLSADQHAQLLAGDPARFGNLNGIPTADRDKANQITLQAQTDQLEEALRTLGIDLPHSPEDIEHLFPPTMALLETMTGLSPQEARQALLLKVQLGRNVKKVTHLLAYEPGAYGGKGRAAIAYGNVDSADNIAFCVPGLNSSLGNINNVASDAMHLLEQAGSADPRETAVVAWQGYDTPGFGNVGYQGAAEAGAKLLAADVNAMRTTHDGPIKGKLTVVGHSYGSTTTGLALQREHMKVDQVALIGSPGVGGTARTAADLHLNSSQVFVGSASRDMATSITNSLGEDPSEDTFGATRFKAESVQRSWHTSFADHSLYYDSVNKSESLYALASIVTGHGDLLGQEGLLAEPRHPGAGLAGMPGGETVDLEASRRPTAGYDHANDPRSVKP